MPQPTLEPQQDSSNLSSGGSVDRENDEVGLEVSSVQFSVFIFCKKTNIDIVRVVLWKNVMIITMESGNFIIYSAPTGCLGSVVGHI